jgi:hypothetical protein
MRNRVDVGIQQVIHLGASSGAAVVLTGLLFSESEFVLPFVIHAAIMAANVGL